MTNFSGENLNAACGGPQGGGMDSRRNGVAEVNPKYLAEAASHTVPVGYKQTEVGVIPEDWEVMRLGHLAKFFKGSGLPKSELSESGKIKCIHYGQLFTTYGPKIDRVISRTKNVGIVTSQENDVLMPTSDVTPNGLATASCITETGVTLGGDILIIRSDKQKLNGVFFSYLVNVLRDQVMQLVTGSTVYHLYGSDMAKFEFAFPSKEEQIAIANALSDVDALISELEKLIAKKQAIKTATMQQLLTGRTRLPQFALREDGTQKGTKPSELGEIPEDWVAGYTKELIAKMTSGLSRRLADNDIGMPVLISGNIQNYKLETDNLKYWYKNDPQGANTDDYVLNDGDILLCFINSLSQIGKPCIFRDIGRPTIYTTNLFRIVISDNSNSVFAYYLFSTEYFQKSLQTIAKIAVNQASFTKPDFLNSKIVYPPSKEEQTAIATILSDMDTEIEALEQRLSKTRQIKQGMMQELLTGKTRLPIT